MSERTKQPEGGNFVPKIVTGSDVPEDNEDEKERRIFLLSREYNEQIDEYYKSILKMTEQASGLRGRMAAKKEVDEIRDKIKKIAKEIISFLPTISTQSFENFSVFRGGRSWRYFF